MLGFYSGLMSVFSWVYEFWLLVLDLCPCDVFDFCHVLGLSLGHNYGLIICFGFGLGCSLFKYNKE